MAGGLAFPTIFLLPAHFQPEELPELEGRIPTLTYNINEAQIVLGKVSKKPRAILELRSRKVFTDEIIPTPSGNGHGADESLAAPQPPAKRRKLSPSTAIASGAGDTTASGTESESGEAKKGKEAKKGRSVDVNNGAHEAEEVDASMVQVVRLPWFTDSLAQGQILPVKEYLVYQGRKKVVPPSKPVVNAEDILKRAREDDVSSSRPTPQSQFKSHGYANAAQHPRSQPAKRPHLVQESTSEHDRAARLPPVPDYLLHTEYACQRPTPPDGPNSEFIEQLKKMRTFRTLEMDEVGVRAYSTSIAAVAAYPYLISSAAEVARLHGCGPKIVELYRQWNDTGFLEDVQQAASNPKMKVLLLFYDIWGVGAKTANEFYNRGWRDLDDIVKHGWDKITRVQQIGVKYYEELQENIPRAEVEAISNTILERANRIKKGFQMVVVGGYRRGKAASGDVDVVLSHPDPKATEYFINEIVTSLDKTEHITHTLTLSSKNSERGQTPVPWKGETKAGAGFDTLDKALVVWQDPRWDQTAVSKNPNLHRRVDIIISPWKTAGCAVVGWSGGTTFERDLRRYCKKVKRLKFDSSGVRRRDDGGDWVDLESDADGNPAPDLLTAEKRVFEKLGLTWLSPEERCTG
ncbi:Nucleotidyltransferase [Astrocystis sublimbata]|nr:Nucleotidyltransferase [Astrocystis sublimbata]